MAKRKLSNFYTPLPTGKFTRPEGAGNFDNMDDYNIVKAIDITEGKIQNTPTEDKHIVNKKYVDDAVSGVVVTESDPIFTAWDKDHADLSNVTADQHHTKYTDAEAIVAVGAPALIATHKSDASAHHSKTVSGEIDHNTTINTHNLTTDIDHNTITNNHNLTTDISHDTITVGTIASHDTTATGTELNTLTDNSMADALHRHSELSASDGSPDPALSVDATGQVGIMTTTPSSIFDICDSTGNPQMKLTSEIGYCGQTMTSYRNYATTHGFFRGLAARGTKTTPLKLSDNDEIFRVAGQPHDGTDFANIGAAISFQIDGVVSNNTVPTSILLKTAGGTGNATEKVRINPDGNVGIGTDSPNEMLSLMDGQIYLGQSTLNKEESGRIRFSEHPGTSYQGGYVHYDGANNAFNIGVHNNNNQLISSDIKAITIERSDGNVGIGTANPLTPLDVAGTIRTTGNIYVQDDGFIGITGLDGFTFDSTAHQITTQVNTNIGIGTESPTWKLDVYESETDGASNGARGFAATQGTHTATGIKGEAVVTNNVGSTAIGMYGTASGGSVNFAGFFNEGNVYVTNKVGIGTSIGDGINNELEVEGTSRFGDVDTNYVEIGTTGDLTFTGSSGLYYGIIAGDDQTIGTATQNVYAQVTFDEAGDSNGITISTADNHMTISKAGTYDISAHFSAHCATPQDFEIQIKKNNGVTNIFHGHMFQTMGVASRVYGSSIGVIDELSANDTLELWVRCTSAATKDIIFDHVSLKAVMIGG